jgi:catechol 2,3-dioxygenase-like lactoylglutathione lyase family enzyme
MAALGAAQRFTDRTRPWAGWEPAGGGRPLFIVTVPFDGAMAAPGNGVMVAFETQDRATVDRVHGLALSLGATDQGSPGLRPEYHGDYYGAYFRDPAGNKVALACHQPLAA